jgi:hypothetical protein
MLIMSTGIAGNLFNAEPIPINSNPIQILNNYPPLYHAGLKNKLPIIDINRLSELRNLS